MLKETKPAVFKHNKYCHCKTSRCARRCPYARANVKCVIACLYSWDPNKCSRIELTLEDSDMHCTQVILFSAVLLMIS